VASHLSIAPELRKLSSFIYVDKDKGTSIFVPMYVRTSYGRVAFLGTYIEVEGGHDTRHLIFADGASLALEAEDTSLPLIQALKQMINMDLLTNPLFLLLGISSVLGKSYISISTQYFQTLCYNKTYIIFRRLLSIVE
jgi:hypothetical protein